MEIQGNAFGAGEKRQRSPQMLKNKIISLENRVAELEKIVKYLSKQKQSKQKQSKQKEAVE